MSDNHRSESPRRAARRAREAAEAPATPSPADSGLARHGRLGHRGSGAFVLKSVAIAAAVVLVSGVSVGAIAIKQLKDNLGSGVALQGEETEKALQGTGIGAYQGGFNILIVGTDNDAKQSTTEFGERDATLNDVNILLHVSADHTNATAVSIPRDLVVPIPSCKKEDGSGSSSAMSAQPINTAYSYGGLNCVVQTVKGLTGLDIPFAGLISFNGVIEMTNAIGGVPVCANKPIHDTYTGLDIPAGTTTLQGQDALAFLRSRHSIGDGSDLGRISSQQVYLSSMLRTIKSKGVLGNPAKLLKLAQAATENMTLSNSLNNVSRMIEIGVALKDLPLANVNFVQYPGSTAGTGVYSGKVQPDTDTAGLLFDAIKADKQFTIPEGSTGIGSEDTSGSTATSPATTPAAPSSGAAGTPTAPATSSTTSPSQTTQISGLTGQTAADKTCSVAYKF
ncbi:LytR family transcriptional attenuator [Frondihabitans sp. PhB188]|uniref:LCP family protein n=1 Tax=Frondihabitans sp. PhB188 TaxID=2485200 RepID=UPI000F4A9A8C|nr:LCP family protein [Frondihabitans sp. PhB188]ROQ39803.1 LytR family transcriptional attenuator [Frondihabitans sp. PhB188]